MQNAFLILGNVAVKISATLSLRWRRNISIPLSAGAGHFDRHQSERQFDVLIYRGPSLHFAILILVNIKMSLTTCSHLAFLQFPGRERPNLALTPYFFGPDHFHRIIEIGEQTGSLQEFFKKFLTTVPIYPRFFSY